MKKIAFILCACIFLFGCKSTNTKKEQKGYTITGKINSVKSGKVYLLNEVNYNLITLDSSVITNGNFELKGDSVEPELLFIKINESADFTPVFVENSKINISINTDSLKFPAVTGSKVHDEYMYVSNLIKTYEEQLAQISEQFTNSKATMNAELVDSLSKKVDAIIEAENNAIENFCETHYNSPVAAYMVNRYLIFEASFDDVALWADNFNANIPDSKYTKMLIERKNILSKSAVGNMAPDFTLPDVNGNNITLSQLKGKYILIDFWASWCGPCRKANPYTVNLYAEFKNKNFDILGVSLDDDRSAWLKAIADDNLTWMHVSDLKGWNSDAAKLYGIISIPHTVLIDPYGKIIAQNLRGEELREKLKEIL